MVVTRPNLGELTLIHCGCGPTQILDDSAAMLCIAKNEGQLLPEDGSCMATVDEDMSEGREALESQVKQHQSATNLNDSALFISG